METGLQLTMLTGDDCEQHYMECLHGFLDQNQDSTDAELELLVKRFVHTFGD
jgi:hypothetical protein